MNDSKIEIRPYSAADHAGCEAVFATLPDWFGLPESNEAYLADLALLPAWVATDARFFREAGIPSYGFSPFLILSSDSMKMKGKNERMAAPSFVAGVELYRGLVEQLVE